MGLSKFIIGRLGADSIEVVQGGLMARRMFIYMVLIRGQVIGPVSPLNRHASAQKAARKSLVEHISSDEGTYGRSAVSREKKQTVRIVGSDDIINQSVGDTQVVSSGSPESDGNTVNTRSRAKRHHTAASRQQFTDQEVGGQGATNGRIASGSRSARGGRACRGGRGGRGGAKDAGAEAAAQKNDRTKPSLMLRLRIDGRKLARVRGCPNTQAEFHEAMSHHVSAADVMDGSAAIEHNATPVTAGATNDAGTVSTSPGFEAPIPTAAQTQTLTSADDNCQEQSGPLSPQMCRVHTDQPLFIWPGCPYGHAVPGGQWCEGDGVLFRFVRPEIR